MTDVINVFFFKFIIVTYLKDNSSKNRKNHKNCLFCKFLGGCDKITYYKTRTSIYYFDICLGTYTNFVECQVVRDGWHLKNSANLLVSNCSFVSTYS